VAPEAEGSNPFTHPIYINCAPVAQLDRVADFESVGRRFESYRAYQKRKKGPLAQLVEQLTLNQ
jgi:hypothetical protein